MAFPGFFRPVQLTPESQVKVLANCTPHQIRFLDLDGEVRTVQPSGYKLQAIPQEEIVKIEDGCEFVKTVFVASPEGDDEVDSIEHRRLLPVGSIISAQAWPGRVVSLVPVVGFERKPPAEKLYRCDKFNIFQEEKMDQQVRRGPKGFQDGRELWLTRVRVNEQEKEAIRNMTPNQRRQACMAWIAAQKKIANHDEAIQVDHPRGSAVLSK